MCARRNGAVGMMSLGHRAAAELTKPEQNGHSAPGPWLAAELASVIVRAERPHPSTQQIGSIADITTITNPTTHARTLRTGEVSHGSHDWQLGPSPATCGGPSGSV